MAGTAPTGEPDEPAPALSRAQKAAILLCLLGEDAGGPVFELLDEASIKRFVGAIAGLGQVGRATVRAVVAEFLGELDRSGESVAGGVRTARALLGHHLDAAQTRRIFDELDVYSDKNVWMRLSVVDPQVLAEFISREHPQAAALILARLAPEHAGRVISHVAAATAQQVVLAIRNTVTLPASSVDAIGDSINRTLFASKVTASPAKPAARVGAIVNHASAESRDSIIAFLEATDADFATEARRSMFTFQDIPARVRRQDVSAIVRAVDRQVLIKALAAAEKNAPDSRSFLFANISSRMAEAIGEEIKEAGAVKRREGDRAQAEVIKDIRELEQAGELALIRDEEE